MSTGQIGHCNRLIVQIGMEYLTYSCHFLMQVDSANRHGILLEVVQILTDLNLVITKAYISSDGGWFMDGRCCLTFCNVVLYIKA